MFWQDFLRIDLAPLLAAILAGLCCTLCGNLLVLRGQSMTVDAISHMVLPGLVAAFLLFGSISFINMFWGALATALLGIVIIEALSRLHDRGAVIGMVFSVFFAIGILLMELFVDNRVHLDVMHILFGSLESVYWQGLGEGGSWLSIIQATPTAISILAMVLLLLIGCLMAFYKELVLVSFDPQYAGLQLPATRWVEYGLAILVTITIVAAFRLVGLILIIGMFVITPLIASFITRRLPMRIWISCLLAVILCPLGYSIAAYVPAYALGLDFSLNIGGTIVAMGAGLVLLVLFIRRNIWQITLH